MKSRRDRHPQAARAYFPPSQLYLRVCQFKPSRIPNALRSEQWPQPLLPAALLLKSFHVCVIRVLRSCSLERCYLEFLCHPITGSGTISGGLEPDGVRIVGAPPYTPIIGDGDSSPPPPYEAPPPYSPSPNGPPADPEDLNDPYDDEPTDTDSQPSQTYSRPSSITSIALRMSSAVSSASCTNTMSGGCCSNATVLTLSGTEPTTVCNLVIDTWVDVAYDFMTGSIAVPASASPTSMPAAPITVSNAGAVPAG